MLYMRMHTQVNRAPQTNLATQPRSEPALELHSRAASSVGVKSPFQQSHHRKQFRRKADKKLFSIKKEHCELYSQAYNSMVWLFWWKPYPSAEEWHGCHYKNRLPKCGCCLSISFSKTIIALKRPLFRRLDGNVFSRCHKLNQCEFSLGCAKQSLNKGFAYPYSPINIEFWYSLWYSLKLVYGPQRSNCKTLYVFLWMSARIEIGDWGSDQEQLKRHLKNRAVIVTKGRHDYRSRRKRDLPVR